MKEVLLSMVTGLFLVIMYVFTFHGENQPEINIKINIPVGQEVIGITYADGKLLYLTRPMTEDYVPQTKFIVEANKNGVVESSVTIIESR